MSAGRSTICLCMIVDGEAESIRRCLDSCRSIVDHWVIGDPTPTADTESAITEALGDIPGERHPMPRADRANNLSELLELAHGKADYLLLVEPEVVVSVTSPIGGLTAGSYLVRECSGFGDVISFNKRLLDASLRWRYKGHRYGHVECIDGPETVERLDGLTLESLSPHRTASQAELEMALAQLSALVQEQPGDTRSLFHLAQTCFELGVARQDQPMLINALEHYQTRADLEDGSAEEAYHAQHQVGVIAELIGDWALAIDAYMRAWELRPQRLESVQRLTTGLRERQLYHAAHRFSRMASRLRPLAMPDDILLVAPWVYEWGMLFEYSITSYWVGDYRSSMNACRALLDIRSLPQAHREQTEQNLAHAVREDRRADERVRSSDRRKIRATGSITQPRATDLGLGVSTADLVSRAVQQLRLTEMEIRPLLREGAEPCKLTVPGLGSIAIRSGGYDLLTLVKLLENPAQLAPTELDSPGTITVLGAGSGIAALFLGRLYPFASLRLYSADAHDQELSVHNLRSFGDRATVRIAGERESRAGRIDLLRAEINGLELLAADPDWLNDADHVFVVPGQEGPGVLLSALRACGFDSRLSPEGEVVGRRTQVLGGT